MAKNTEKNMVSVEDDMRIASVGGRSLAVVNGDGEIFGNIFWYGVSSIEVKDEEMERLCVECGVDFDKYFNEIKRDNVYRNMTNPNNYRNYDYEEGDMFSFRYMIRPADKSRHSKEMKRWVVEEKIFVDKSRKPIHKVLGSWNMDDEGRLVCVKSDGLDVRQEEKFDLLSEKLFHDIERMEHIYTEKAVRDAIRRMMGDVDTIPFRSNGVVFFAPVEYNDEIVAISRLMERLDEKIGGWGGIELTAIPVNRSDKHKDKIYYKFEAYAVSEAEKLVEEINGLLEGGSVGPKKYKSLIRKIEEINEIKEKYGNLLESEFTRTEFQMDVLGERMKRLLGKMGGE